MQRHFHGQNAFKLNIPYTDTCSYIMSSTSEGRSLTAVLASMTNSPRPLIVVRLTMCKQTLNWPCAWFESVLHDLALSDRSAPLAAASHQQRCSVQFCSGSAQSMWGRQSFLDLHLSTLRVHIFESGFCVQNSLQMTRCPTSTCFGLSFLQAVMRMLVLHLGLLNSVGLLISLFVPPPLTLRPQPD